VAECVLAKDETGVQFSLAAHFDSLHSLSVNTSNWSGKRKFFHKMWIKRP